MSQLIKKDTFNKIQTDFISQGGCTKEDFQREVSFAVQIAQTSPRLQECEQGSILKSVLNVAQIGLTLNPVSKYAYLIPRYNGRSKQLECVLEPSYIGLLKLLTDSGSVSSLQCQIIWEGDEIEVDLGSDEKILKHVPYFLNRKDKGNIRGVYSKAKLHDGSFHCEIMSYADICEIKERSESYKAFKDGKLKKDHVTWITDEPEMCRKTVLKRHFKYLPKSHESKQLETAISLDNQANGFDSTISFQMIGKIEGLIDTALLSIDKKEQLREQVQYLEWTSQGKTMIEYLNDNQPEMGYHAEPKSPTEAQEATKRAVERDER